MEAWVVAGAALGGLFGLGAWAYQEMKAVRRDMAALRDLITLQGELLSAQGRILTVLKDTLAMRSR